MSKPALRLVRAALEQAEAEPAQIAPLEEVSAEVREARRLAELAGAFALFGLEIHHPDWDAEWSAEQAYVTGEAALQAPANDSSAPRPTFAFPDLDHRGAHVHPRFAIRLIQAIDWVVVGLAAEVAALWGAGASLTGLSLGEAAAFVLGALSLKLGLWLTETYRVTPARIRPERGVGGLALGAVIGLVIANLLAPDARGAAALAATLPLAAMLLGGVHAALAVWIRAAHRAGVFAETVVLVGAGEAARRLVERAARTGEARIVAVVDDRLSRAPTALAHVPVGGGVEDLLRWPGLPHIDRIVITVTQKAEARVRDIIARLGALPNRIDLLIDYEIKTVRGRRAERFGAAAVACVSGRPQKASRALVKRIQDVVIGAALLSAFALPMLAIALALKCDGRGPVLQRRRCFGLNNRIIEARAFRAGQTRLGRWLRRTRLDRLPQLTNVLTGDMSLVGPAPHAVDERTSVMRELVSGYAHRHRVKPGLTGWAQVNGDRARRMSARRRLKLDLEYVSRACLWFDLQILARTCVIALRRERAGRG